MQSTAPLPRPAPTRVQRASDGDATPAVPRFSIATLVNDMVHYEAMRASFRAGGFDHGMAEYLYIDNTGSERTDAYRGLNLMIEAARAPYVILCHQDVRLIDDGMTALEERLRDLDTRDPSWALAGNAGGIAPGRLALRITDPHGSDQRSCILPQRVITLDENFIVMKRAARIGCSADLSGFHFYGPDLCLNADVAGYTAYVIDFHLHHLSAGNKSASFHDCERAFREKWHRALRPRWLQSTCTLLRLSGSSLDHRLSSHLQAPLASLLRRAPFLRSTATLPPAERQTGDA